MGSQQSWRSYEAVARELLNRFREEFGLERVDPKQKITGSSGTSWEIDAKGVREGENSAIMEGWEGREMERCDGCARG